LARAYLTRLATEEAFVLLHPGQVRDCNDPQVAVLQQVAARVAESRCGHLPHRQSAH
jgi:hypothetical protein